MAKIIDLSGLACPLPVVRTKEALEGGETGEFIVVVDHEAARDNVSRFAQSRGCTVSVAQSGSCYHLTISPPAGQPRETCVLQKFPGAAPAPRSVFDLEFAFDAGGGACAPRGILETAKRLPFRRIA